VVVLAFADIATRGGTGVAEPVESAGSAYPRRGVVWLVGGAALLLVSNGRWILPTAAWLAPIGWLVYLDRTPAVRGLTRALPVWVAAQLLMWRGLIPAPGMLYYLIAGTYAVVYFLPFVVHRLMAPRLAGAAVTLVFPAAWVGIEFVFQRWVTPYGSWFSLAYTQSDNLALLQLTSVTGAAGVSFLMTWFAAMVAWIAQPTPRPRVRASVAYAASLTVVLLFGRLRLSAAASDETLVRVAGLVPRAELTAALEAELAPARAGTATGPAELERIAGVANGINEDLLARTRREARAGARLVVWSETAARVLQRDERALLERVGRLAAEAQVDVIAAYGVWDPRARPPFANKLAALAADGALAWTYDKAHPIAGAESPLIAAGAGSIERLVTAYGSVGGVICHDLDFPALLRQAARAKLGLVVGPSADWRAITPLHADMAMVRAIENGVALFRPTSNGRSLAVDARGRTLMRVDYADDAVVAFVSATPATRTVYGAVGDVFAWLTLLGLGVLLIVSLRRR